MAKDKGGRETRKPKQEQNKKVSGQTPQPVERALAAGKPATRKG
ncbi:MAG: hypothetical protein JWN87_1306 [Frankiales bacterium]|jgi:hypothetical protein|nr:hypothetical protein [Frankiales bacterium]